MAVAITINKNVRRVFILIPQCGGVAGKYDWFMRYVQQADEAQKMLNSVADLIVQRATLFQ